MNLGDKNNKILLMTKKNNKAFIIMKRNELHFARTENGWYVFSSKVCAIFIPMSYMNNVFWFPILKVLYIYV